MTTYKNLTIEIDGPAAVLSIARPAVFNALNDETVGEIASAILELEQNPAVRGIIITGGPLPTKEGKPARHSFISGADINELAKQGVITGKQKSLLGQGVLNAIEGCDKPVIAAINGFCFGGGFELALACHWRYASENAQIGLTEATLGIIPGYGGTQRLARLVGKGAALEMIATGARIGPQEALQKGIVNKVTTGPELLPAAKAAVAEIAKCGPLAVAFAIEAVNRGLDTTLGEGLRIEADLFGVISASEDMREGLNAFLEKRPPAFKNR
jgi:enoyl-CoA hydratase